jgi:transcriptional regulator with XRE-family HTH domain
MPPVPRHSANLAALGSVLRDLRKERGLTQEQLSFKTGMTTALISDSENGKRNLSFESIGRLLKAFGVTWEDFGTAIHGVVRRRRSSDR